MKRRDAAAMAPREVAEYLHAQRTIICATNGSDGYPHLAPLWYLTDTSNETRLVVEAWTYGKSQKVVNLRRDARATLQVESGVDYTELAGVMLACVVEIIEDRDVVMEIGSRLAQRYAYGGPVRELDAAARARVAKQGEKRVGLRFVEQRRATWDHSKLA